MGNEPRFEVDEWLSGISSLSVSEQYDLICRKYEEIMSELNSIKHQLDKSKASAIGGDYSDPHWFAQANAARRVKGFQVQRLQEAKGRIKTLLRQCEPSHPSQRSVANYFMDLARDFMSPSDFTLLKIAAEAKKNENDSQDGRRTHCEP